MPRNYKKPLGSRNYKNYEESKVEKAIQAVLDGRCTLRGAAEEFNIPYGTIYNRYHGKHIKKPGAQPVFSEAQEKAILQSIAKCADWGFPLSLLDLRMFAKALLDRSGRIVAKFQNNIPGVDWAYSLLKRHKDCYSQRVAANIKRARAQVSKETLTEYFENLKYTVKDVPSSNIFNYDESNLSDDPGKKRYIYRRGVKYPEKITNFSKSCTSIMVCGSADGVLLPPYVIYRSTHLYDTWKERGPCGPPCCSEPCCSRGTRYNRTSNGWMDTATFREWFISCFLPHAKRLHGRKVLIGDNLSSHLDDDVLRLCQENNISFICLVPNSTHLLQPLDVALFRPMKEAWRFVLTKWKMENMRLTTLPKDAFPGLLNKALIRLDEAKPKKTPSSTVPTVETGSAIKRNLMNGFKATGILPFNPDQVFKRLPPDDSNVVETSESVLTQLLKEQRHGEPTHTIRKKKRLHVAPGKSISTLDQVEPEPSTSQGNPKKRKKTDGQEKLMNEEITEDKINQEDSDSVRNSSPLPREEEEEENEMAIGRYVLAKFYSDRGKKTYRYVCYIIDTTPIVVRGLKSVGDTKKTFKLVFDDISEIEKTDIVAYLPKPIIMKDDSGTDLYVFPFEINIHELSK